MRSAECPSPPTSPLQRGMSRQISPSFRFEADHSNNTIATAKPFYVLHPHSSIALLWQLVSLMTIFWDLIVIPLQQFDLGDVDAKLEIVGRAHLKVV